MDFEMFQYFFNCVIESLKFTGVLFILNCEIIDLKIIGDKIEIG